jgi:predicted Zn finger-like uncharacterized protein
MSATEIIGYIISAILLFFGVIFAWASSYDPLRLVTSAFLFIVGFALLYYIRKQKPTQIIQKLELPGQIKVQPVRCPNCGASLDINQTKIIDGVPSIECSYCGHTFEVTEEPKW